MVSCFCFLGCSIFWPGTGVSGLTEQVFLLLGWWRLLNISECPVSFCEKLSNLLNVDVVTIDYNGKPLKNDGLASHKWLCKKLPVNGDILKELCRSRYGKLSNSQDYRKVLENSAYFWGIIMLDDAKKRKCEKSYLKCISQEVLVAVGCADQDIFRYLEI